MDNLVHFLGADYKPITQPVDTYSSLSYEGVKWGEYGNFKFVAAPSLFPSIKDAKRVSVNGNTFLLDNIVTKDATANNELSVSGRSLEALFDKVVNPTPLRIRGNLEVQIRAVVTALAITGVQAVSKLALGTIHGYLNSIDTVVPRGSLGLWLYTTLNQRGFTYTLTYEQATDTVVFDIVQEVDRSTTAVFSAQIGNIENVEYSKSDTDACNFAVVYDDETGEVVYVDESNGEEKRALLVQGKSANTASDDKLFVMIGADSRSIYTSTDGTTFALKYTFASDIRINDVAYSVGLFIACGYSTTGNVGIVAESSDAINWTTTYTSASDRIFERITYDDGLMVCVIRTTVTGGADSTVARIATSYDGITFSLTSSLGVTSFSKPRYLNGYWWVGAETVTENNAIIYRSKYGFTWEKLTFAVDAGTPAIYIPSVGIRDFISQYGTIKAIGYVNQIGSGYDLLTVTSDDLFETATIETFNTAITQTEIGNSVWVDDKIVIGGDAGFIYSSDGGATFSTIVGFDTTSTYRFVETDGETIHVYGKADGTGTVTHFYTTDAVTWSNETITTVSKGSRVGTYGASTQIMSMRDIGKAELSKNRSVEVIDGDVLPGVAPIIGTDCNIGDIAAVVDIQRGIIASKRLVSAKTVIEKQAHYTVPKFGTDYLSLTKYIAKEIAKNV